MRTIPIPASRPYDVLMARGLLSAAGEKLRAVCPKAETAFLLTDDHVAPLYEKTVADSLSSAGFAVSSFVMPHGEPHKTVETWHQVLEEMCARRLTRGDVLVALGGGVVGDLGGFAAATYQRGIPFIQIPTTLLAMVDSSVGGKTAVDLAGGKNQVGCFYQPSLVLCDPDTLKTLPPEEYRCGCAEIIKYAMIGSASFAASLAETPVADRAETVIQTCVEMKRDYVLKDEFDTGLRMMLNFGHTFGHAAEALSGFSILHGQGVAMGMAIMARSACAQGILPAADRDALLSLLRQYGLPTEVSWSAEAMARSALNDKKAVGHTVRLIVPEAVGRCRIQPVPSGDLVRWLRLGGVAG